MQGLFVFYLGATSPSSSLTLDATSPTRGLSSECETERFCPRGYQSNLSVIFAALDATSPTKGRLWCFRKVLMFFR